MNTLTIQLEDSIFGKITSFARRHGRSAEEVMVQATAHEIEKSEAMERFEAMQKQTAANLTQQRIDAAFAEISALNAAPLPGDELPAPLR